MKKILLIAVVLFLSLPNVFSQVDNRHLENTVEYKDSNQFSLHLYNHNYMRNYEYFNRFADGLTYFGSIVHPEIIFNAEKNLSLQLGYFVQQDYGIGARFIEKPTFSINYHPGNWQIIAGKLNGNLMHRLPEPMYNYDRIITHPLEFGNQFIYTDSNTFFDAWINWERMIYKVSPNQEEVSGGFHYERRSTSSKSHIIKIPINLFAYHKGGQVDTPDRNLITFFNISFGLEYQWHYSQKPNHFLFGSAELLNFIDYSNTKVFPFDLGFGVLGNLGWRFGHTTLSATYWKGNDFFGVHGAPIYQSVSDQINNVGLYSPKREILFIRLISDYQLYKNFSITTRLEPYFDLKDTQFEFSNSLFFTYRNNFALKKKKAS